MSRSNETVNDLLTGLLHEAITKRQSGIGRTFYLLSTDYIAGKVFPKLHTTMKKYNTVLETFYVLIRIGRNDQT